jgi:hypothetical protein
MQMQSKPNGANTLLAPSLVTNLFVSYFDIALVSEGDALMFRAHQNLHKSVQQKSIRLDARDVHPSLMPSQMQSTLESSIVIAAEKKQSIFIGCITAVSERDVLQEPNRNFREMQLVWLDARDLHPSSNQPLRC